MSLSRREFIAAVAGVGCLSFFPGIALARKQDAYAIAGRVLDGSDGPPLERHAILIADGRIEAIVPAHTVSDRPILDYGTDAVVPGIINAHCHRAYTAQDRRERWLTHGVTAIGDVGAPLAALDAISDNRPGTTATAAYSGPMLAPPGGYPLPVHSADHALVVDSPHTASETVRMLADNGASMVKISFEPGALDRPWPMLDPATAAAVCDTARSLGLTVRCHVEDLAGLAPALDAGVHVIDHVPHRWVDSGKRHAVLTEEGEPIPAYRTLLEKMARNDVILVPTLDVFTRSPWNGPQLFEPVRAFHAMGGSVALGNDFPYRRTDAGLPLREMTLLDSAGLDGAAVLRAATRNAARACNFTNRGRIAPGMAADLLVLGGNPARLPQALEATKLIIKDGLRVS